MDLTAVIITALTGSGGVVALLAVILQHKQKMAELQAQKAKTTLQLEQVKSKQIPLEHHPIFAALDEIEFFFLRSFEIADPGRTVVIREMCVNKLRVWRDVLRRYAIEGQMCFDKCGSSQYAECNKTENVFRRMLLEGLERYTAAWDVPNKMDVFGRVAYDAASLRTMQVFIPIFQEWHRSREEVVRMASHDIPNSGMNNDCYADWWDILTVYMYAFTQMKYDALNAMKVLNGEITGRTILGITIGDAH